MPPHRATLKKSLLAIERAFSDIEGLFAEIANRLRLAEREGRRKVKSVTKQARPRQTLKLTPKRRAQLKLQGAYMGFMRQLKPGQKVRVKAVKEKRGFEAAIRLAKKIAVD